VQIGQGCSVWQIGGFRNRVYSIHIPEFALTPFIRDRSPMRECRLWGSVRGAASNGRPYRDCGGTE